MANYNDFNPFSEEYADDIASGEVNRSDSMDALASHAQDINTDPYAWNDRQRAKDEALLQQMEAENAGMSDDSSADYVEAAQAYNYGYNAGYQHASRGANSANQYNTRPAGAQDNTRPYAANGNGYGYQGAPDAQGYGYGAPQGSPQYGYQGAPQDVNNGYGAPYGGAAPQGGQYAGAQQQGFGSTDANGTQYYTNRDPSQQFPAGTKVYDDTSINMFPIGDSASKLRFRKGDNYYQPRSKVIALVLLLFLGCFGVHDFYMGKTAKAVIMLLLFTVGALFFVGPFIGVVWLFIDLLGIIISTPTGPMASYALDGRGVPMTWLP